MNLPQEDRLLGGMWGVLVGDALGVPVEFSNRSDCDVDPVSDMRGHGTHDQPAGTWSDDGAMTLCTVESLIEGFDTRRMAELFVSWYRDAHWTANGRVFDIGIATRAALGRIISGIPPDQAGGSSERDNGNGALMRILPVVLKFPDRTPAALFSLCEQASRITHGHPRSALACGVYCVFASELLHGASPHDAYAATRASCTDLFGYSSGERAVFDRVLDGRLSSAGRDSIGSSGYVLDTLEAAIWCMLQGGSFADMTLRAVNLGGDTDTTGAVTGGLAGLLFGRGGIPHPWLACLPRHAELDTLFAAFIKTCLPASRGPAEPRP